MTRRAHTWLTGLFLAGTAVTLFQCWYVYLPPGEAGAIEFCRFGKGEIFDCYETLNRFGHELVAWILPVFPTLLALFFLQLLLAAFAWTAQPAHREAWLGLARLVSFPAAGLAVYVLLNDYLVASKTSLSAVVVFVLCLATAVLTVISGLQGIRLAAGARWAALFLLASGLLAYFVHGTGAARREIAVLERIHAVKPPELRWSRFARQVPRAHAARLGNPKAETEVLLFLDESEASRGLIEEALALDASHGDAIVFLYGRGEFGTRLVLAQQEGELEAFLRHRTAPAGDAAAVGHLVARQDEARKELEIEAFPTALWNGGRRADKFTLADVLAAAGRG